jgi:hypothetical protein
MNPRFMYLIVLPAAAVLLASCASQATPPPVDAMGTAVAQAAYALMTQTAAAASPTPPPTATFTPVPTDTPTLTPTSGPHRPTVLNNAACWFGPGPQYPLESHISTGKRVDLLGVGSVSGWYIIMNPYFHKPCWVQAEDLQIEPGTDLSQYPVMTPGAP